VDRTVDDEGVDGGVGVFHVSAGGIGVEGRVRGVGGRGLAEALAGVPVDVEKEGGDRGGSVGEIGEAGTSGSYSRSKDAKDDVGAGCFVGWAITFLVFAGLVLCMTAVSDVVGIPREEDGAAGNGVGLVPVTIEVPVDWNIATPREPLPSKLTLEGLAKLKKGQVGFVTADVGVDKRRGLVSRGGKRRGRKWGRRVADIRTSTRVICVGI